MLKLPKQVQIFDVCCRDGFQNENEFIPTDKKIQVANTLSDLGFKRIEVGAFVSPKAVPQMSDSFEVIQGLKKNPNVSYMALVPNLKGAEKAAEAGVDELNIVISTSEAHNRANINMSIEKSLEYLKSIMSLSRDCSIKVNVSLATSFGCPFTGDIHPERVTNLAKRILELGDAEFILGDTTGMANPVNVHKLIEEFNRELPQIQPTLHFHNTRGFAMACILTGLEIGATKFDGSLGGLGGCPFAPGAAGNVATEDVVHMMEEMGIETGIDLDGLINAAKELENIIGRTLPSYILRSGKIKDLHPTEFDS